VEHASLPWRGVVEEGMHGEDAQERYKGEVVLRDTTPLHTPGEKRSVSGRNRGGGAPSRQEDGMGLYQARQDW